MSKPILIRPGLEVYKNGTILLIRCPRCKRENWAMAVADGVCCWCGYNAHHDENLAKDIRALNKSHGVDNQKDN